MGTDTRTGSRARLGTGRLVWGAPTRGALMIGARWKVGMGVRKQTYTGFFAEAVVLAGALAVLTQTVMSS